MGFNKHHINDQIKADGIDGACGITEEKRNAYRFLVGKSDKETPLGRVRQ